MILEGKLFLYADKVGDWAFQDDRFISLKPPRYGVWNEHKVWDINNHNRFGVVVKTEVLFKEKWVVYPDPIYKDPDYRLSSLYLGEKSGDLLADKRLMERYDFEIKYQKKQLMEELNKLYGLGDWRIDDKYLGESLAVILPNGNRAYFGYEPKSERPYELSEGCLTKVTVKWDNGEIENDRLSDTLLLESWDFDGLHILNNDDLLTILNPKDCSIVWSGKIDLIKFYSEQLYSEQRIANGQLIASEQKDISREKWANYFLEKYPARLLVAKEKQENL